MLKIVRMLQFSGVKFPKYAQVNSAMQIQLEVTDCAEANIEQRYDHIISVLEASVTIPNVIEMQV